MDKQSAKQILLLYRPGTDDGQDPQIAEALQFAKGDAELSQWFDAHCKFYIAMREKLRQIPVPQDLKQKLHFDEAVRRGHIRVMSFKKVLVPLAAAAVVAFLAVMAWPHFSGQTEHKDFASARQYMVKFAQRLYGMNLTTSDLGAIHNYIVQQQYPDYTLTKPLAKLTGEGCATLQWQNRKVSMICLKANPDREYFLFVMDRAQLPDPPAGSEPQFQQVLHLMSMSWTQGDKIYILAGPGDASDLRQFLD